MKILSKRARAAKNSGFWQIQDFTSTEAKLKALGINPKFLDSTEYYTNARPSIEELAKDYDTYLVGYKAKPSELDTGYFYCPYIPLMHHVHTAPVQKPVYSKLSVIRERGVSHRFGRTGDR